MITQASTFQPAARDTCLQCPDFNNYLDPYDKGWCNRFDSPAKTYHEKTNNCILNDSEVLRKEAEQAFLSEIVWTDREGYSMGNETVENAYFDPNFVTYPNEPF